MLDETTRQRIMLQQEGAILASVGSYSDASVTCEIARCQLDGITNALIRIQGSKETASFVFALSDRVAGGVRDVTDCPPFLRGEPKVIEAEIVKDAPPRSRSLMLMGFAYGFLCGLGAMMLITLLAMGR